MSATAVERGEEVGVGVGIVMRDLAEETGEAAVHDFAAAVARATDAEEVHEALVAAVLWAGGASARLSRGDEPTPGRPAIPIMAAGGRSWGRIEPGRSAEAAAVRRLEAIAAIAALAFDRLERATSPPPSPAAEGPALHDATLLSAVLPFAIGQARRHGEPLSVLFLAIDQLRGVRMLLGPEEADRLVSRVGLRVASLLRSSDLVGRLDDDRLMAILPRAELAAAAQVGRKLARAVAVDPALSGLPLDLSLSVGAAELPASAETIGGLLDAADAALSEARRRPETAAFRS
ncbi:GGDEF domain-containing protein [Paludisphaera sp.]|uniref:GGDEF domain-containing protein n=1 Tax=Paludisphaera sp. TaxID=2017432 RepID=UPI00301E3C21